MKCQVMMLVFGLLYLYESPQRLCAAAPSDYENMKAKFVDDEDMTLGSGDGAFVENLLAGETISTSKPIPSVSGNSDKQNEDINIDIELNHAGITIQDNQEQSVLKSLSDRIDHQGKPIEYLMLVNQQLTGDLKTAQSVDVKEHLSSISERLTALESASSDVKERIRTNDLKFQKMVDATDHFIKAISKCDSHMAKRRKEADEERKANAKGVANLRKMVNRLMRKRAKNQKETKDISTNGLLPPSENPVVIPPNAVRLRKDRAKEDNNAKARRTMPQALRSVGFKYEISEVFDASRYYLFDGFQTNNIMDARDMCRTVNAYLAEMDTSREFEFIQKYVREGVDPDKLVAVYIGGTDRGREGDWKWPRSGKKIDPAFWNRGQPNEYRGSNCAALIGGRYYWNMADEPCFNWDRGNAFRDGSQKFLCEENV